SIRNKKTELYNIIASKAPDVILGTETHLNSEDLSAELLPTNIPSIDKYQIFRKDRSELVNKRGGGVIIMVRPGLQAEECSDLDSACEIKWIKIKIDKNEQVLVGSFYREPKATLETLDELENSLLKANCTSPYKNMKKFLGGDFNLGDVDWDNGCTLPNARDKTFCDKLIDITSTCFIEQINRTPTRKGRILDLFFTSHPTLIQRHVVGPPIGLSDHDILSVTTFIKPVINKLPPRTVFNYRKADWRKIKDRVLSFQHEFLRNMHNNTVDVNWNNFKQILLESMEQYIPKKTVKGKSDIPWLSKNIKRLIKKKRYLYNIARKSNNASDYKKFSDLRKTVRNKLHTSYYNYISNLLDPENDKSSKSFWKYIKSRKQDSVNIGTLKNNGQIAESASHKAEMLNNQFCSVFTKESLDNLPNKGSSPYCSMPKINVTLNGVVKYDIARSVNLGHQVDMAVLDFSKAFDKVSHQRLSVKMQYYGICNETNLWINEFLNGRYQRVVVDGESSRPSLVTSGDAPGNRAWSCIVFTIY
ncbi:uncharacterized protein LOC132735405, partial [Ruditapes philippinarum]|uniref:uncharacterized protein LOC132735405 n=1 Tax=Ruditapes philippinarum TaxID=129788 RepID=UPI00295B182D